MRDVLNQVNETLRRNPDTWTVSDRIQLRQWATGRDSETARDTLAKLDKLNNQPVK